MPAGGTPGRRPGCPCADGGRCAERYANLLEQAVEGVFVVDESSRLHDVNPAGARLFGFTPEEMLGCTLFERIESLDAAKLAEAIRSLRAGGTVHLEKEFRRKDGTVFPGTLSARRLSDGNIQCILRDISQRRQAEEIASSVALRLHAIFEHSPIGIFLVRITRDHRFVHEMINPVFAREFGVETGRAWGRTPLEILPAPVATQLQTQLESSVAEGADREYELSFGEAGDERVKRVFLFPVRDGHGCIRKVAGFVSDITGQRRAELERTAALERARHHQEDFTGALIQSQETERRRIAGELHDGLGQDLLLIKTRLQLALTGQALRPEAARQFEQALTLVAHAVDEVRRISHALRPHQLDHLGLTEALRALLSGVARTADFRLEQRIDDIEGVFRPEQEAIWYRVVQEALTNILKHAHARHVDVVLEHDVHTIRLIVADDGCGFAVAQGPAGGLGLRNIAERVRILGGHLRIDSAPGTGTRIEAEVPKPAPSGRCATNPATNGARTSP